MIIAQATLRPLKAREKSNDVLPEADSLGDEIGGDVEPTLWFRCSQARTKRFIFLCENSGSSRAITQASQVKSLKTRFGLWSLVCLPLLRRHAAPEDAGWGLTPLCLQCRGNHEHAWKQTSEGKREYPSSMIRRLVNGFVHDLRPPQLHMFLSEADRILSSSPAVFVASSAQETEKDVFPAERERVRKLIHRLHVSGGYVSKTSLRLLLQRRGCLVWVQQMVDQLQCDSCLESSNAKNSQQVSLATPPKLWQAVKVDIFEQEDFQRKGFFALYMDAACKLSSCSCFWKEILVRLRAERCDSHFTSGQGLDAAFSAVPVFDFGPWWMFRQ